VRKMAAAGTIAAMTPAVVEARMEAEEISERKSAEP
jgi:hypothetical protein